MSLKLQLDVKEIASSFKEFSKEVAADLKRAVGELATLTRAQIALEVQSELHTSRKIYMDNLSDATQTSPGVWVITLDEPAMFIEEGIAAGTDMKPGILKGAKSKVIPFKYDTTPAQTSPSNQLLVQEIKQRLRKEKIPYKTIEYDKNGSPRIGKLHDLKWGTSINGGNRRPGKGNTPLLQGLSVYQKMDSKTGNVRRDILTFRTVSSGPKSAGKWINSGLKAKKYFDKAFEEAQRQWEDKILPEILAKWDK